MAAPQMHIRPSEELDSWLRARAEQTGAPSPAAQARTELELWRATLAAELARIRLTLDQVNLVAGELQGTPAAGGAVELRAAEALSAAAASGDEEFARRARELQHYLLQLGPTGDHALRDAIARHRAAGAQATAAGWASVGVRVVADQEVQGVGADR